MHQRKHNTTNHNLCRVWFSTKLQKSLPLAVALHSRPKGPCGGIHIPLPNIDTAVTALGDPITYSGLRSRRPPST